MGSFARPTCDEGYGNSKRFCQSHLSPIVTTNWPRPASKSNEAEMSPSVSVRSATDFPSAVATLTGLVSPLKVSVFCP